MFARPIGMLGLAVLCVCLATPQKQKPITFPKMTKAEDRQLSIRSSSDWQPLNVSAKTLLAQCDAWMAHLTNVSGQTQFEWAVGPSGDPRGQENGALAIVNSRTFRVDFGNMFRKDGGIFARHSDLVADGSKFQVFNQDGFLPIHPVKAPRLPHNLLAAWPERAQDLVFTDLGANEQPLMSLYRAATAAGLRAVTEKRTVTANGITAKQVRVVLKGSPLISGKRARFEEEILIDAPTGALVKLTQYRQFGNNPKTRFRSSWSVKWDRSPGQAFSQETFQMAPPTPHAAPKVSHRATHPSRRDSR